MIKMKVHEQMGKHKIKSIRQLSEVTGISRLSLTKMYNENGKGIEYTTLDALCRYFNCSVCELLEYVAD